MNLPEMPSNNQLATIMREIRQLRADFTAFRSSSGTLDSATIYKGGLRIVDPATTAQMLLAQGQLKIWDDFAANPDGFGLIYCDAASSANLLRWFPPHDAGTGLENSVTVRGTAPGQPGAYWVYTDGVAQLTSVGASYVSAGSNIVLDAGDRVYVDGANAIDLVTPKLRLYGLGDTGTAANLTLDIIGGEPIVRRSVSSDRYKDDVAPVDVDVDDLLAYSGITWTHSSTATETPVPWGIRRNVGNHAEAMDALPSLRQFVNYDDQGRPDSVEDSRFVVAVHEGWKRTHRQVTELEQVVAEQAAEIATLKRQNAAILTHLGLDALPPSAADPQE